MKVSAGLFNLLAVLLVGMTALVCVGTAVIFINPTVFFNPFKPVSNEENLAPTVTPIVTPGRLGTATNTPELTATHTPGPTIASPSATAVPSDTTTPAGTQATATLTLFPSPVGPTATEIPTEIPTHTRTPRPPPPTATGKPYPAPPTVTPGGSGYP